MPSAKVATFNVSITNTTSSPIAIRLAIAGTATPTTGEYIEYDTVLAGNGVLERGGLVATAGKYVVVSASAATSISVNVYGFEG